MSNEEENVIEAEVQEILKDLDLEPHEKGSVKEKDTETKTEDTETKDTEIKEEPDITEEGIFEIVEGGNVDL